MKDKLSEVSDRLVDISTKIAREMLTKQTPETTTRELNKVDEETLGQFRAVATMIGELAPGLRAVKIVKDLCVSKTMWDHSSNEDRLTCLFIVGGLADALEKYEPK